MSDINPFYMGFMMVSVFISSVSQIFLKKAANKKYPSIIKEYLNPLVIGSYTVFVIATFLSIYAYKGIPLSAGPIIEATGYIYITIWGALFFKEKITPKKLIAIAIIIVGDIIFVLG